MPKPVPFELVDTDPNITEDSAFGTTWRDTWKLRCPQNINLLLEKGNEFSVKLYDSADAEYAAPDALVKIEARDPSEQKVELVYGPENYLSAKEFQDRNKIAVLDLEHPIVIKPRSWLVIMTKDDTGMDAESVPNSYFRLKTTKLLEEGGK